MSSQHDSEEMNWMDELEAHIVQSLTSEDPDEDVAVTGDDASEAENSDEDEGMDIIDLTPSKPTLPTRTESILVPTYSPPSPPPPSPEIDEEEEDEEQEEEDDEDEDHVMSDDFPMRCSAAFATGRHHGYSRSALHNLKEFWSSRYDEWIKISAYNASRAYDGIIKSPRPSLRLDTSFVIESDATPALSPSSPSSATSEESSPAPAPSITRTPSPALDPNSPIFPRVGDIARLRDPRPVMIDRAFCHVPLYSISKIVFAHEITRVQSPTSSEDGSLDGGASGSVYSDDTLVEEELPVAKKGAAAAMGGVDWFERWKVIAEKVGGCVDDDGILVDKSLAADSTPLSWADEVQRARSRPQSPSRKFFFALDDEDFSERDFDDDGDEDEEDYGTMLSKGQSSFASRSGTGYGWERAYGSDFEMLS